MVTAVTGVTTQKRGTENYYLTFTLGNVEGRHSWSRSGPPILRRLYDLSAMLGEGTIYKDSGGQDTFVVRRYEEDGNL